MIDNNQRVDSTVQNAVQGGPNTLNCHGFITNRAKLCANKPCIIRFECKAST